MSLGKTKTNTTTATIPEQNETTTRTTSKGVYPRSRPVVASSGSSLRLSGSHRPRATDQNFGIVLLGLRGARRRCRKGAPRHSRTGFQFRAQRGCGGDLRRMSIKDGPRRTFPSSNSTASSGLLDQPFQGSTYPHPQRISSFIRYKLSKSRYLFVNLTHL